MLEKPYIKFIHTLTLLTEMNKKILCFITKIFYPYFYIIKGVYQQEISPIYGKSSETLCNITYNFDNYFNLKPLHKNKINEYFLE